MYVKFLVPTPSTLSGIHGVSCCNSCTTFNPTESFAISLIYFMMRKQPRGIQGLWIKPLLCLVAAGPEGLSPKASHTVQWSRDLPHPLSWSFLNSALACHSHGPGPFSSCPYVAPSSFSCFSFTYHQPHKQSSIQTS